MNIKEKVLKEVQKDGEVSVEDFDKEMLQFSKEDIGGYIDLTLTEVERIIDDVYTDGKTDGKEDILKVLRKYPISANFDDAMDVLKFKEKVKAETLTEVGKVIDDIPVNETFCFDCNLGFDEDSDECFRCDGKNIEHREMDISKEKLKETLKIK